MLRILSSTTSWRLSDARRSRVGLRSCRSRRSRRRRRPHCRRAIRQARLRCTARGYVWVLGWRIVKSEWILWVPQVKAGRRGGGRGEAGEAIDDGRLDEIQGDQRQRDEAEDAAGAAADAWAARASRGRTARGRVHLMMSTLQLLSAQHRYSLFALPSYRARSPHETGCNQRTNPARARGRVAKGSHAVKRDGDAAFRDGGAVERSSAEKETGRPQGTERRRKKGEIC